MKISAVIITKNEEKKLEKTLIALKEIATEIIIVDSGSTDKTLEIASHYTSLIYFNIWKGYGEQRNFALTKTNYNWILMLDSDEVLSKELKNEILKEITSKENKHKVFAFRRDTICFGKNIKFGGWSKEYKIRLFEKGSGSYNLDSVHEKFITKCEVKNINKILYHYTYLNLDEYLKKINKYTTNAAIDRFNKNRKSNFIIIIFRSFYKFINQYFFRLGFLDGIEGYLLAYYSSVYVFLTYTKLRELNKNKKISD